ncbi:IreB family regulatory phosphoprotein [bacterium]|nr:IreB family regulatory phosphoprotein [bacterium]
MEETISFDSTVINDELILKTLNEVKTILVERGYNASNQIVGYLISGDPGYITSYKNARNLILSLERSKTIETLLRNALK